MANFRRNKPRRTVRCVLCTPYRCRGNHTGRFKEKEEAERRQTDPGNVATATKTRSPKRNWSRNKKIRALRAQLTHLGMKRDKYAKLRQPPRAIWANRLLEMYDRNIASYERQLVELGELA